MDNNIFVLLPDVVQAEILTYLTIKEQLKLRLICRDLKEWIDKSWASRLSAHIPNTVVRNNGRQTFTKFCNRKSRIPHVITDLHVENSSLGAFEDVALQKFLARHSNGIISLRIKRYFIGVETKNQHLFLEALTNLTSLEIDEIWVANNDTSMDELPANFPNLKKLILGNVYLFNQPFNGEALTSYQSLPQERKKFVRWHAWSMVEACLKLDFLRVPISPKTFFDNSFDECFRLLNYIRVRTREQLERRRARHPNRIMQIDLDNFMCCTSSLEVLLTIGARLRAQFLNVNSKVYKWGSFSLVSGGATRADSVYSFLSTVLVSKSFQYLEKIVVKASAIQDGSTRDNYYKGPQLFPTVKEFEIIYDVGCDANCLKNACLESRNECNGRNYANFTCFPKFEEILKFFFPKDGTVYRYTRTLTIIFVDPVFANQTRALPAKIKSILNIIESCPNVNRLNITGFDGKPEIFLSLWEGFSSLKTLVIDKCPTLKPSCFIDGDGNPNNPSNFQFLRSLERVVLKGIKSMPLISSGIGMDVFTRIGLVPFTFLTFEDAVGQKDTWIRPSLAHGPPALQNRIIVTRSITRGAKAARL